MSFNAIPENKILAKICEFSVHCVEKCISNKGVYRDIGVRIFEFLLYVISI